MEPAAKPDLLAAPSVDPPSVGGDASEAGGSRRRRSAPVAGGSQGAAPGGKFGWMASADTSLL